MSEEKMSLINLKVTKKLSANHAVHVQKQGSLVMCGKYSKYHFFLNQ